MNPSKTGTREWSTHSDNIQTGCSNGCLYCYARERALRFGRIKSADEWTQPVIREKDVVRPRRRLEGVVMFPTAHDLSAKNLEAATKVIGNHLDAGNRLLLVTKPREVLVAILCGHFFAGEDRSRIEWRMTIGCLDDRLRAFWEPGAPPIEERLRAGPAVAKRGFRVSVSAEPLLDPPNAEALVEAVEPWAETIWIGACNHLRQRTAWTRPSVELLGHIQDLERGQTPEAMRRVYEALKGNPKVRWKDSYRQALDLPDNQGIC